mmetsp:Transcript_17934/g.31168  ORF Transcript_17934/g.31168 Transcript_17934/m.31168 type:complete len:304 (+) Transcript_17934:236-1147(+)
MGIEIRRATPGPSILRHCGSSTRNNANNSASASTSQSPPLTRFIRMRNPTPFIPAAYRTTSTSSSSSSSSTNSNSESSEDDHDHYHGHRHGHDHDHDHDQDHDNDNDEEEEEEVEVQLQLDQQQVHQALSPLIAQGEIRPLRRHRRADPPPFIPRRFFPIDSDDDNDHDDHDNEPQDQVNGPSMSQRAQPQTQEASITLDQQTEIRKQLLLDLHDMAQDIKVLTERHITQAAMERGDRQYGIRMYQSLKSFAELDGATTTVQMLPMIIPVMESIAACGELYYGDSEIRRKLDIIIATFHASAI